MLAWTDGLRGDPLPWLLDEATPAVRHLALRQLLGLRADDPVVADARQAAMGSAPISSFLAAQAPEGWWAKPGSGYGPKHRSTVWSLVFLDQLGADGADERLQRGCRYLLEHATTTSGGFGAASGAGRPPPSMVAHCLNGNLLRALIGFGWLDDERVQAAIAWHVGIITGAAGVRWYATVPGPGFRCGSNGGLDCAWGASKALLGLARIPADRRDPATRDAIDRGVAFLLSRDPSVADYPMAFGNTKPNGSWFRLGFPSGYVTDILQVLEALCEADASADPRLGPAVSWLLDQQDDRGRWANRYAYQGKMVVDVDRPGGSSKWVTLRACRVLRAVAESQSDVVPRVVRA